MGGTSSGCTGKQSVKSGIQVIIPWLETRAVAERYGPGPNGPHLPQTTTGKGSSARSGNSSTWGSETWRKACMLFDGWIASVWVVDSWVWQPRCCDIWIQPGERSLACPRRKKQQARGAGADTVACSVLLCNATVCAARAVMLTRDWYVRPTAAGKFGSLHVV